MRAHRLAAWNVPGGPGRARGIGLMSGTSADGVDAAVVDIRAAEKRLRVEPVAAFTLPYPPEVRQRVLECQAGSLAVRELCLLHARLGELFADAAEEALRQAGAAPEEIDFAASHGQTVWHEPDAVPWAGAPTRGTLQIGEAARIAARLGVPVVCDFRQQDFALGGQGAPLVPYVDHLLFADPGESRAVQNLGGIGNVTYLPAGAGPDAVVAFDTGPANALLDAAAALATDGRLACDRDGLLAAAAPVDAALLAELLAEPYLDRPPPKSTGRELFSAARVRELWQRGHRGPALLSTLTQLTVESISRAYRRWLGPVDAVILGGGGASNPELVRRLRQALAPARVLLSGELGVEADAKEAVAFAVLGFETLRGRPSSLPGATGAARAAVQGKVCWP